MVLVSMTGYCSINEHVQFPSLGPISVTVELKTLNGRFFEVVSKLSSSLSHLEIHIVTLLQEKLIRGRVYLNVRLDEEGGKLNVIVPSWSKIGQYLDAIDAIKSKYKLADNVSLTDLIQLPDVLVAKENEISGEDEKKLLELIVRAAEDVMRIRIEEGMRLEKDFENIFKICSEKVAAVEKIFNQVIEQHKEALKLALEAQPQNEPPSSHIEEMQITLRKIDIHEEIIRFRSHLDSIESVLQTTAIEKGRRLDFILQELMRETNTMMAKCSAYKVSTACIDIKVELEKAREQIQNIV